MRLELGEDQLRALAAAFNIAFDRLPPKISAVEKLTLACALKQTSSVSREWLAEVPISGLSKPFWLDSRSDPLRLPSPRLAQAKGG